MDSYLPSILHRVCNVLKNHLESVRNEARSALTSCLKELGLEYLQFVIKDLLSVIENDILGDVVEQREVEKIAAKMKETRRKKSFESLKLVAQNITFKSCALKLLAPVTTHLQKHVTPTVKAKLENMLLHIAAGRVVAGGLLCSHLITVFGLRILRKRLKGMRQDMKNENTLSLLDPFVKLLTDSLSSEYEDILSSSLGCLTILAHWCSNYYRYEHSTGRELLLAPVTTHLQKHVTPTVKAKLENMLLHIAAEKRLQQHLDFLLSNLR
ncbi:hypothetical protein PIB30_092272, partial [Stylosanthes scabra]|nr:hypothetical protein [Stylosanthes scabra]